MISARTHTLLSQFHIMIALLAALFLCAPARAEMNNKPLHEGEMYENRECLMCHSAGVMSKKNGRLKAANLEQLRHSVHKEIHCVQCHRGARLNDDRTHMTAITLVECGDCHYKGNKVGAPQKDIAKQYDVGVHSRSLIKDSHSLAPHCWDCHTGHSVRKINGKELSVDRDRIIKICTRCHYDQSKMRKYNLKSSFIVQYDKTPHALARKKDKKSKAAICTDCHGNHDIRGREDPKNPLSVKNLPEMCGKCHKKIFETYKKSVHGADWLKGNKDVPVCSTCHGEHEIRYIKSKDAKVEASHIVSLCSDCHASVSLTQQYKIKKEVVLSYKESFHGIVNKFGDDKVANCASCHGFHDILPSNDSRSSIHVDNLPKTCGKCHKKAEINKFIGNVHTRASMSSSKLLFIIQAVYILMIVGSIGGMLFYAGTDLFGFFIRKHRGKSVADHVADAHADPDLPDDMQIERWPIAYRTQHALLVLSFTMLAITGAPLLFPEFSLFQALFKMHWLYELRGITHRIFAGVMTAICVYHVIYVIANKKARKDIRNMIPGPRDAKDALNSVLFNLTIKNEHPHMPRYNFIEKFEYLAMAWGSFVMVASGAILMFNTFLLRYFPKVVFDVATIVHKYEALLATLAIIIWHMYTVHLCPDFFPMNKVFLTGKISLKNLRKHHGEEYDEIVQGLKENVAQGENKDLENTE